ncbi:MAG TPA: trimethylamine methyltransferase family protein, partial [Pseudomonadales bacterium]|nr:trimethylamine methyltransferase [Gammaproteobacteria bacterium]MDP6026296.1 trimethylamine methyltransferase family protein [Pseudomonadales bacterium]MDP7451360.1 trimethylamine methyltransferase family protein [Arenicellales bacterium]MDP7314069.1 trimethylamine methyltransferase family protein [Pseudomonadales bacterium]HJL60758.1 trimethylamine methyltransferase family protein [Pseudomonadales bacterium]
MTDVESGAAVRDGKRSGGRTARRNARTGGSSGQVVRPGLPGGQYRPLSDLDIERIYDTALDLLENVGIGDPIPEILHYALPKGCTLDSENRLRFPRALVEELIEVSAKEYKEYAPDPAFDLEVRGTDVLFSTSGEAVSILDYDTQSYRPSRLVDLYDATRLADQLEHIHSFGQPFIAAEYSGDLFVHDINIAYAELAGTRKSFSLGIAEVDHIDPIIEMFDTYLGEKGGFLKRPFCTFGGCPIVSPLRFAKENAEVLVKMAELGLPGDVAVAPQAGATSPAALAGTLAQCFAETLSCLCVMNLVRPGSAINFGMWPFISDLRTGSFTGGSGEEAVVMAASVQLCNHFGFITSVGTGMTDAKTMDVQAGYEKALTTVTAALAGSNLVAAYPGIVGSLIGQSFEGMVIDNDMIGNIQRILRGIEVTDETLSYDVIKEAVEGTGHFLDSQQTLDLMRSEFLYPDVADRLTPGTWESLGHKTLYEQAHERVGEMLENYYPQYIDPAADRQIREKFPIRLNSKDMQKGNGRW